jgi:hypothetical protein
MEETFILEFRINKWIELGPKDSIVDSELPPPRRTKAFSKGELVAEKNP